MRKMIATLSAALAVAATSCISAVPTDDIAQYQEPRPLPAPFTAYTPGSVAPTEVLARAARHDADRDRQPVLRMQGIRTASDFTKNAIVESTRSGRARRRAAYEVNVWPKLLIVGQRNVEMRIRLSRPGRDLRFAPHHHDSFHVASIDSGLEMPIDDIRSENGDLIGTIREVTSDMTGWHELGLVIGGEHAEPVPYAVRVIETVRVALTFDDGPSVEHLGYLGCNARGQDRTPTEKILDVLNAEGITAAFFVLTSPDSFLFKTHAKAETNEGFELLCRMASDGHVVAAHWGGTYKHQTVCHPTRMNKPAYDYDGDGIVDKVSAAGNALETDLLQCVGRINEALEATSTTDRGVAFVRPPLWKYCGGGNDARPTYEAMGLKMIFTDTKLFDGGYPFAGFTFDTWLNHGIDKALSSGVGDIVVTMHDSNPHTARDIEQVLAQIRSYMADQGLAEGSQWRFVDSAEEMLDVFRTKTDYVGLASAH